MRSNILPPSYFIIILLVTIALHFIVPTVRFIRFPVNLLGIVPIAIGAILNLWADALFKKNGTTVKPYEHPTSLLINGPFRVSRHPMYLGMTLILFGMALLLGSLITFIFPLLFIIIIEIMFISVEEKNMQETFGDLYHEYRKKVRRWI